MVKKIHLLPLCSIFITYLVFEDSFKCKVITNFIDIKQVSADMEYTEVLSRSMGDEECDSLLCEHARFGISLTKMGDVNMDSYQGRKKNICTQIIPLFLFYYRKHSFFSFSRSYRSSGVTVLF